MNNPNVYSKAETKSPGERRLAPLDMLRGLIMVLMAVDHANYFVAQQHPSGEHWGGAYPTYPDVLSFLTRLITHPAAPGFSFLMGTGMLLFAQSRRRRGWSEGRIMKHFLQRGAILIAIQFLIVNPAWQLGPEPFPRVYVGVLFALGGGMMLGSLLIRLQPAMLAVVCAALFVGLEFTHPDPSQWGLIFDQPLGLLFGYSGGDMQFWSNYPILPWLELVVFGMLFGHWLYKDERAAYTRALWLGASFLAVFVVLRGLDGFGNIRPRAGESWIDFLNVVKYPPAMTFTLLTMGINLLLLNLFGRLDLSASKMLQPLVVYGRVPMFFYILHLYLYAALGMWFAPNGTSLEVMYLYWLFGLLLLYPVCRWYAGFKSTRESNSLWRLF